MSIRTAALTAWLLIAKLAAAQEPQPTPAWPAQRLRLQMSAPQGLALKLRPATLEGYAPAQLLDCPEPCQLVLDPGRYQVVAEPPPQSDLRRVVSSVDLWTDANVEVIAGNESDHRLGVGLTIPGGIALGVGLVFYAMSGQGDTFSKVMTYAPMAVGAPLTACGIYFLVRARNRVTVDAPWQRPMESTATPSGVHIDAGWRF